MKLVLWGALPMHKKQSGLWLLYSDLNGEVLLPILRLAFMVWQAPLPSSPTPQNHLQKEIGVHSFWEGQKSVLKVLCKTAYTLTQGKNNESLVTIKLHEEIAQPPENRETRSFCDSNTAAVIHHCMICYFSSTSWQEGWSPAPQQSNGSPTELKKGVSLIFQNILNRYSFVLPSAKKPTRKN